MIKLLNHTGSTNIELTKDTMDLSYQILIQTTKRALIVSMSYYNIMKIKHLL